MRSICKYNKYPFLFGKQGQPNNQTTKQPNNQTKTKKQQNNKQITAHCFISLQT